MPERVVISNTSPLLYLHQIRQMELLAKLYGHVKIPAAVEEELQAGRRRRVDVPTVSELEWARICQVGERDLAPSTGRLGAGEAAAITLGTKYPSCLLILDDLPARRIARNLELSVTGTLGVLVKAKQAGFVDSVIPLLEDLKKTTMWLPDDLVKIVLEEAGEST